MGDHKTVMIDLPSPWGTDDDDGLSREDMCRSVDKRLDEVAADGWTLVGTQIVAHAGKAWLRVLVATFRRGKPRSDRTTRGVE